MDFFERLALGQPVTQDSLEPALTKLVAWEERLGLLGEDKANSTLSGRRPARPE